MYPGDLISHKNIIRFIKSVFIIFPSILFGYVCIGNVGNWTIVIFLLKRIKSRAREFSPLSLRELGGHEQKFDEHSGWLAVQWIREQATQPIE